MLVGSEIRRFYKIENNISESCIRDRSRLPEKSYFLIKASWESLRDGLWDCIANGYHIFTQNLPNSAMKLSNSSVAKSQK